MTTTISPALANGIASMEFTRGVFHKVLDATPEDKITSQPWTGANHALWNVGHIALTDNYFLTALSGQESPLPESWEGLFGMGSQPVDDASKYPSFEEVKEALAERRTALIDWLSSLSEEKLAEELPENLRGFAANHAALPGTLACHEALHVGQITACRKAFGLDPAFG